MLIKKQDGQFVIDTEDARRICKDEIYDPNIGGIMYRILAKFGFESYVVLYEFAYESDERDSIYSYMMGCMKKGDDIFWIR